MSRETLFVCCLASLVPTTALADQSQPVTAPEEAGGRLVVSGGTIVVVGNPDTMPSDASVATKVETPLPDTPRSVSITERRTLDEQLGSTSEG